MLQMVFQLILLPGFGPTTTEIGDPINKGKVLNDRRRSALPSAMKDGGGEVGRKCFGTIRSGCYHLYSHTWGKREQFKHKAVSGQQILFQQ